MYPPREESTLKPINSRLLTKLLNDNKGDYMIPQLLIVFWLTVTWIVLCATASVLREALPLTNDETFGVWIVITLWCVGAVVLLQNSGFWSTN